MIWRNATALLVAALIGLVGWLAWPQGLYICQGANCPPALNGISLSANTFAAGSPSGTPIGSLSVIIAPGSFTGSYQPLQGPDASKFQIVGSQLETLTASLAAGAYNITVCAQQVNAVNSFICEPFGITGTPAMFTALSTQCGSACLLGAQTAGTVSTSSTATLSGGPFTGIWNFRTTGTDDTAGHTPCVDNTGVLAIDSNTGAIVANGSGVAKVYAGTCLQAAQAGVSNSPYAQAISIDGRMQPPAGYTFANMIVDDNFTGASLNTANWYPGMSSSSIGPWFVDSLASPYTGECTPGPSCTQLQYFDPYSYSGSTNLSGARMSGGNGVLSLSAIADSHFSGFTFAAAGVSGFNRAMLIPAAGGYMQIRYKPSDQSFGSWCAFWTLPTNSAANEEFDVNDFGINVTDNNHVSMKWFGYTSGGDTAGIQYNAGEDLTAAFHVYGVEYRASTSIKAYFDGTNMHSWVAGTNNVTIPPVVDYEIILTQQMASSATAGFHNVSDPVNHPGPFVCQMTEAQIYSIP